MHFDEVFMPSNCFESNRPMIEFRKRCFIFSHPSLYIMVLFEIDNKKSPSAKGRIFRGTTLFRQKFPGRGFLPFVCLTRSLRKSISSFRIPGPFGRGFNGVFTVCHSLDKLNLTYYSCSSASDLLTLYKMFVKLSKIILIIKNRPFL